MIGVGEGRSRAEGAEAMLHPILSQAKAALKTNLPVVAAAYRGLRQVPGMQGTGGRRHLNSFIRQQTGSVVASGPFRGMRLVEGSSWGDGDVAPKLLGTYEQELHDTIERFRGRSYDAVVDIGCAEGYYAVGLARLFPTLTVYAFDTNRAALGMARSAAQANGVEHRLRVGDFCDWPALSGLASNHPRLLVISDCEGYEADLFGRGRPQLAASDLIIECHDTLRPNSTEAMAEALAATHEVRRVDAIGRNPNQFPFLTGIHETDRWLAVCENRPCCSHWLACDSRSSS